VSAGVIVIGGGGHGRVVIEALRRDGVAIAGVIDPARAVSALLPEGVPWLGGDEVLAQYPADQCRLANGVGSIGDDARRRVFERMKAAGYGFTRVLHPAATIAFIGVSLSEGCQIMAGAVVQPGARIGADAIVNTRASVDHDCIIGDHVHIASGAVLCGDVVVGEDTHIGAGAVVIQGRRIGAGCLIGAGATVLRDVPDRMIVYSHQDWRERPRG
jgi:sugar O-acyltransferase (sialic acid O-acetyltransferase NeuD family)